MTEESLPDFSGKVVIIAIPANGFGWTLLSPTFERHAEKLVVVGKPLGEKGQNPWGQDATVCIPWRYVAYYVIYPSIEAYRSRSTPDLPATKPARPARSGWLGRRRNN